MEIFRILLVLGFLAPGYYAMEIQPSVLPRNLDVYCKFCDGLSAVFDNFSYEDYDFWRTIDIQEKVKFFCSFCKKKTESTTKATTITRSMTTTTSPLPETSSVPGSKSSTPKTSSAPASTSPTPETSSAPASTSPTPETSSVPASTSPTSESPSSSSQNPPPGP